MKLLNQPEGRTVKYFDIVLTGVPDWVTHIATESSGNVWGFEHPPCIGAYEISWKSFGEDILLAQVDLEGMDWKSTLMTIC